MSKQIARFGVPLDGSPTLVLMPAGAVLLHVGAPRDLRPALDLWAIVDPDQPIVPRLIHVVGTNAAAPPGPDEGAYIGSAHTCRGSVMWHLFDGGQHDQDPDHDEGTQP